MAEDIPDSYWRGDPKETLEMDRSHAPQSTRKHHKAGTGMEPSGSKKSGETTEHLAKRRSSETEGAGYHLEGDGESGSGPG